ncbi:MAG: HNH endonuclease family protein, partial [Staphylococcus equorum]|nr:HNH endonuclease family protein [Staphylococcus equorum]
AKTESSEFNRILKHINIMESKVVYPYFMMLLDMQQNSEIDWDKLINLAHIMESCLFRLKACRHATNGMNRIIITLCDKEKTKSDLQKNEIYRLNRNFPDDAEFKESLLEVNLYKLRNNLAKLALVVLEENRTRETINFDNAQVEHVMPQRLNNDWRLEVNNADKINEQLGGTIGNLTLTMYNQEMSNKLFSEKKEYYAKSNVSLTREISEKYQRWDKDAIIDRTRELSTELCQIFAKPDIKKEKAEDIVGEHAIDEEVDVTGKKPIRITLNDRDYSIDSWRSALVIFLNYVWAIDSRNFEKIRQDDSLDTKLFTHFNHPAVLANNMKIETNYSATTIVAIIAKIADLCDISNEVKYTIK